MPSPVSRLRMTLLRMYPVRCCEFSELREVPPQRSQSLHCGAHLSMALNAFPDIERQRGPVATDQDEVVPEIGPERGRPGDPIGVVRREQGVAGGAERLATTRPPGPHPAPKAPGLPAAQ